MVRKLTQAFTWNSSVLGSLWCLIFVVVVVVVIIVLSYVMSGNSQTTYEDLAASSKTLRLSSC